MMMMKGFLISNYRVESGFLPSPLHFSFFFLHRVLYILHTHCNIFTFHRFIHSQFSTISIRYTFYLYIIYHYKTIIEQHNFWNQILLLLVYSSLYSICLVYYSSITTFFVLFLSLIYSAATVLYSHYKSFSFHLNQFQIRFSLLLIRLILRWCEKWSKRHRLTSVLKKEARKAKPK